MLELTLSGKELYDDVEEEFVNIDPVTIRLEHSLVSISKWESKWRKPFLKPNYKFSQEEFADYVKCMTITQNVDPMVYAYLSASEKKTIQDYIDTEQTATTFNNIENKPGRQIVTSELIYYWMTLYQIPFECQKWHISRLLTLIQICNIKNGNQKKMSPRAIMNQNRILNAQRRKATGSKG